MRDSGRAARSSNIEPAGTQNSEAQRLSFAAPSEKLGRPSSELRAPSKKLGGPSFEHRTPGKTLGRPSFKLLVPGKKLGTRLSGPNLHNREARNPAGGMAPNRPDLPQATDAQGFLPKTPVGSLSANHDFSWVTRWLTPCV
jgi:hypothetical protein